MQKMYWRPPRMSLRIILLLALISAGTLTAVEVFRIRERQPWFKEKRMAARLSLRAFQAIKRERIDRGIDIDKESDPTESGVIGELMSLVTTNKGHLSAKQTSINPNFAAVVVDFLTRVGVNQGDTIAVGVSGSFPAINIAVYAAIEALKLNGIVISSTGASQWGANHPKLMWPDMEHALIQEGVFRTRSAAITPGGIDDSALGLSARGRRKLRDVMMRSGLPMLEVEGYEDSLNKRMVLYAEKAGDHEIRAYINVGGGAISVGTHLGKQMFRPGINRRLPRGTTPVDSIMARFVTQGIPVIHLSGINKLAQRFGMPLQPNKMPPVGEGKMFVREAYNLWLTVTMLGLLIGLLFAFLRLDLGHRLFPARPQDSDHGSPEPMI